MLVPEHDRLVAFGATSEDVAQARNAAGRILREAIGCFFVCPVTLEAFPTSPEGAELRALVETHGVALAAYLLSSHDGGRSKKVEGEAKNAKAWLQRVSAGDVDLSPLARRSSGPGAAASKIQVLGDHRPEIRDDMFRPLHSC